MIRFTAIRHIDGGELFDEVAGRAIDFFPSFVWAEREADRLNRMMQAGNRSTVDRRLAKEALGLS